MTRPTPQEVREAIGFLRNIAEGLDTGSVEMVGVARTLGPAFGNPGSFCLDYRYVDPEREPIAPPEPRIRTVGERIDDVTVRRWPKQLTLGGHDA